MKLQDIGEFGLIERIRRDFPDPEGMRGIGDDCAVIPQIGGLDTLISTDMLVEGSHFLLEDISPRELGWKSAAVNISDIAAMGGTPAATFLSFALPKNLPAGWIDAFMQGYSDISSRYNVALLGGDTTASPDRLCINVAVLGSCPHGTARLRSMAREGDLVCVTGTLGDSAAGLQIVLEGLDRSTPQAQYLLGRHHRPIPRVSEGLSLASCPGVHAMMDISDGIASDLRHIMEESGLGASVELWRLPLSDELKSFCALYRLDAEELAATGGEDYELLFTMEAGTSPAVPYTVIGRMTPGYELVWPGSRKDLQGFRHF